MSFDCIYSQCKNPLCGDPDVDCEHFNRSQEMWNEIFSHGESRRLLEWQLAHPKKVEVPKRYFCTFTRNPKAGTKQQWFALLLKTLNQSLHTFICGTIEHVDSNIHCHAILESKYNLSKDRYKAFFKANPGSDNGKELQKIKWDNGTNSYLTKENFKFKTIQELEEYFLPKIQELEIK